MQETLQYCALVNEEVKETYGLDDGGDLCFTLIQAGIVDPVCDSIPTAARVVAQHLAQA